MILLQIYAAYFAGAFIGGLIYLGIAIFIIQRQDERDALAFDAFVADCNAAHQRGEL